MKQARKYFRRRSYFELFSSTNAVPGEYYVKMRSNKQRSLLLLNSVGILSRIVRFSFGLGFVRDLLVSIHGIFSPYIT
jgi:hypothetical protein